MNTIKFLIVDDELLLAHSTASMLQSLGFERYAIEPTLAGAIKRIEQGVDVALLDINLGRGDEGIELGKICAQYRIPFIYISSYSDKETLDKALQLHPSAYLIKPITEANLYTTLQLLLSRQQQDKGQQILEFKDGTEWVRLKFETILYLKSESIYVNVITQNHTYLYRGSLASLMDKLPGAFVQTHRAYAVNPNHVNRLGSGYMLINGEEIPVSRSFKNHIGK